MNNSRPSGSQRAKKLPAVPGKDDKAKFINRRGNKSPKYESTGEEAPNISAETQDNSGLLPREAVARNGSNSNMHA